MTASTTSIAKPGADAFVAAFELALPSLPGQGVAWLDRLRQGGIERFRDLGLPGAKVEDWKYTRLRPLEDTAYRPVAATDGSAAVDHLPTLFPDAAVARIVFVNGCLRDDLTRLSGLPKGVTVESLGQAVARDSEWVERHLGRVAVAENRSLLALNTAMMNSGVVIRVARNVAVETPIEVVYVAGLTDQPVAYYPRNLIVLEEGAAATIVKHYAGIGVGAYFANSVSEISVGANARLRHYRVQTESMEATHLGALHVRVGRDATYETFGLSAGGRLSRNECLVRLEGEGAHCGVNGAYLMKGREHCDNTTLIEHTVPHTTCREVFKGVLDDEARGVFQGKIVVHKDAQKTDGQMLTKTLLLADGAEMDAKPELEIYADDVKCSHGATSGRLDETALFYLRSRGIPEALARNLLVRSFVAEAIAEVSDLAVREALADIVVHKLPAQCYLAEEWTREGGAA
ncbi:MAG: Fe-S cluster assembly protein SufD [Rhodospirillaceae bacterium]